MEFQTSKISSTSIWPEWDLPRFLYLQVLCLTKCLDSKDSTQTLADLSYLECDLVEVRIYSKGSKALKLLLEVLGL